MGEFPAVLTVGNFRLQKIPATAESADIIYNIFASDSYAFRFWMPSGVYNSPADVLGDYSRSGARKDMCLYGIYQDNELLGEIGFANGTSVARHRGFIGYWLKKSARDRGIISSLMGEILRVGFNQVGFEKIIIQCAAENLPARKIAERFGFALDGVLRREIEWTDGTYGDECVYSKLKSEWEKENNNA